MKQHKDFNTIKNIVEKDTKNTGKIASVILVVSILANILGLAAFQKPQTEKEYVAPPYVVEECIDLPPTSNEIIVDDDKEKQPKSNRISILSLSYFIASWLIDTVMNIFPHILSAVLTPLGVKALGWILFAGGIILSLIKALKKAFPDMPLKELLSKKRLIIILLLTVAIIIACEIALYYLKKWMLVIKIAALILGMILLICTYQKIKKKLVLS